VEWIEGYVRAMIVWKYALTVVAISGEADIETVLLIQKFIRNTPIRSPSVRDCRIAPCESCIFTL
jgi:hypothetical protein